MSVVDFAAWVTPNLQITLGGRQYSCPPPSVARAKVLLAFTVLAEHRLELVKGEPDPDLVALAGATTEPLPVLTLGQPVLEEMEVDGLDRTTIDRVGYYALQFWTRGKAQADWLAVMMWSPDEVTDTAPKARRPSKSGPSTG